MDLERQHVCVAGSASSSDGVHARQRGCLLVRAPCECREAVKGTRSARSRTRARRACSAPTAAWPSLRPIAGYGQVVGAGQHYRTTEGGRGSESGLLCRGGGVGAEAGYGRQTGRQGGAAMSPLLPAHLCFCTFTHTAAPSMSRRPWCRGWHAASNTMHNDALPWPSPGMHHRFAAPLCLARTARGRSRLVPLSARLAAAAGRRGADARTHTPTETPTTRPTRCEPPRYSKP